MGALCALPADSAAPGSLPALGCRLEPILSVKWAQGGLSREQGAWLRGAVGATHPPRPDAGTLCDHIQTAPLWTF